MYLPYTHTLHGYYSASYSELRQLIVLWSNTKQLIRVFKCLDSPKLNNLQKDAKINGSHVLSRAASFRTRLNRKYPLRQSNITIDRFWKSKR